jgi:hypothetical protein
MDAFINLYFKLLDFRGVIAKMLGLDISSLAVPDYEIIARVERLIATINGTMLHAAPNVPVNVIPVNAYSSMSNTNDYLYSSSSSIIGDAVSSHSPHRRRHHHHRERSPSPQKQQQQAQHHHHHHNRSKSPRKVTIDPNSY